MAYNPNYGIYGTSQGLAGGYGARTGLDLSGLGSGSTAGTYNPISGLGTGSWLSGVGGIQGLASLGLQGLQGYTGLQNVKLGKQQLGLAREQFGFERALANRNLANQAQMINTGYANAAQVAAGQAGGGYGMVDPAIVQQYADKAKGQYVSGSAI